MREALKYREQDAWLFGTYHQPAAASAARRRVGFLFLNTGHAPRAGHGAFIARVADVLAGRGAHVFRFDFPGCGDSPGDVPAREETFWRHLQTGGFDAVIAALLRKLARDYRLDAVITAGMCGGGVVAITVADLCPELTSGMLLMEPAFTIASLQRHVTADGQEYSAPRMVGAQRRLFRALLSPRSWARAFSGKSQYTDHVRTVRTLARRVARRLRGEDLPSDFNLDQIRAFKRVLERKVPTLVLNAAGSATEKVYLMVHQRALPARRIPQITLHGIPKTNHTFTTPGADDIAIAKIIEWVDSSGLVH